MANASESVQNKIAANEKRITAGLSVTDGVAVLVGVVIGIGIFGFPPLVAQQVDSPGAYMGLWIAGALIMLVGALCYAELGAAYPHSGGEYHFLQRAWGPFIGLLFAWARGSVIQTGSIAAVAFIYGEYAQQIVSLGPYGVTLHGALAVSLLTVLNMIGTRGAKGFQLLFTSLTVLSLFAVILAGLFSGSSEPVSTTATTDSTLAGALGMGMVFVLLTYGGWNEAAYLSGELRHPGRDMSRVLIYGTVVVTVVYLLTNYAYLHIFGLAGLADTHAVGAELMNIAAGPMAAALLSVLICIAALSTMNATILTGARVYYALGRDVAPLSMLGTWNDSGATPSRALALQGLITLALIGFGTLSGNGISAMVAYTAPVFWLFMGLTALAVIRLRQRDPQHTRPFMTPLYPLTPALFALTCAGLLWSSVQYAGAGTWLGLLVLAAGIPMLVLRRHLINRTAGQTGLP